MSEDDHKTGKDKPQTVSIPQAAAALGYAGALPFIIAATAVWILGEEMSTRSLLVLIGFGALILSFLGGVRWGLAMLGPEGPTFRELTISVIPTVIAWAALLVNSISPEGPYAVPLGILMVGLLVQLWSDHRAATRGLAPGWYPGLRIPLTILVVLSLGAALVRVSF